jgi:hypothetical protein
MTGPAPALLGAQPGPVQAGQPAVDPYAFARALGAQMAPLGEEVEPSPRAAGPGVPPKKRGSSYVAALPAVVVPSVPAPSAASPAPGRFTRDLVVAATPPPAPDRLAQVLSDAGATIAVQAIDAPPKAPPSPPQGAAVSPSEAAPESKHRGDPPAAQDPPPEDGATEPAEHPSMDSGAEDSGSPSTIEYGPTPALPAPAAAVGPTQPPVASPGGFIEAWKAAEVPVSPWVPDAIRVTVQDPAGRWEVDVHRRHDQVDMVVRGDVGMVPIVRAVETELRSAMDGSGSSLGQFSFEQQDHQQSGDDARREEAPEWQPPPAPRPGRGQRGHLGVLDKGA